MTGRFDAAHAAVRADPSIQFSLGAAPPPPEPPVWLRAIGRWLGDLLAPVGRFLRWLFGLLPNAPYARILLWSLLALLVAVAVWMIVERLRSGEWRLPRRRRAATVVEAEREAAWQPDAAPVRSWLEEADRLAAAGRYADAIHHLLFRSIEDIGRRRPQLRRPSLTSRELAAAEVLPPNVRACFAAIMAPVERSLFGRRGVSDEEWRVARAAYADLALSRSWRA